ncbi:MAG: molybdopterin-dependent oxidoreductase [Candidatus Eiseniibacteriota bacterium]|nr:MAG: molybdopterin-dependent oxidoreductase [Candidatus Eisenbacteria bacterium]
MAFNVRIDDKETSVELGTTVLQAASEVGIYIPHLCYHRELSLQGSCRVCLVEVEGTPKLQPACSTLVCAGMKVKTDTPAVREARRGVLELMTINHPLDCPVCDKGGECKLQDYVFAYGRGKGRFAFPKRTFSKEDIGPFVVRDMNRCIHCTRCVRFASEVTLTHDVGAFDRGRETSIGTYLGKELRNPFSGNVTQLCPVGALTDRVFRFKARVWELESIPSVCPLCPVGCLTELELDSGRIVRIKSRKGGLSPWICDLGRFGHVRDGSRRRKPFLREESREVDVPWDVALDMVAGRFRVISKDSGPASVGVLCSTSLTNEEFFAVNYVFRNVLGSPNVDFRVRTGAAVSAEEAEVMSTARTVQGRISQLAGCDSIHLFCCDPCEETPVVGLHVCRAADSGARLTSVGPRRVTPRPLSRGWIPATPVHAAMLLAFVSTELAARAARSENAQPGSAAAAEGAGQLSLHRASQLTGIKLEELSSLLEELLSAKRLGLVVGAEVFESPHVYLVLSSMLRICAARAALGAGETVLLSLLGEGNVRGALDLGVFPGALITSPGGEAGGGDDAERASGSDASSRASGGESSRTQEGTACRSFSQMLEAASAGKLRALLIVGSDPIAEYADREAAKEALRKVEFLVVQSETLNATAAVADVYLPLQSVFEKEGTVLSLDGRLCGLSPQESEYGKRSLLFDVLESIRRTMRGKLSVKGAASVFREANRLHGWGAPEDMKALAAGSGVELTGNAAEPSEAWMALRDFEKKMRFEERAPERSEYPYVLICGALRVSSWGWVREFSEHELVPKEDFAEISASDAAEFEIREGDLVEIESPRGSVEVRAVATESLMPGVVFLPRGLARTRLNCLTSGGEAVTRVRVRKKGA